MSDGLLSLLNELSEEEKREEKKACLAATPNDYWFPQEGPQTEAYFSDADLLLYGGAAGGGKTDLIVGLGLNEHQKTHVFRQQTGELEGLLDRMDTILSENDLPTIVGRPPEWNGPRGKKFEFGHLERPKSEKSWQGRDADLKAYDEAAQMKPQKIIFTLGWNRSTIEGQRVRAVLASNPPIGGEGEYLIEWFGPWVDPMHPLYGTVKPGELLWAVFIGSDEEIRTHWCDGPGPVEVEGELRTPKSRTFIPASLEDNKYLGEDYRAQLDAMPEPMRTALLTGDFLSGRVDHKYQIIPTEWVDLAQQRWLDNQDKPLGKMLSMGCDVAQGGKDNTTLAPLHEGNRFESIISEKGVDTKDGPAVGGLIVTHLRDRAAVCLDMTGGWGGGAKVHLETNNVHAHGFVASQKSHERCKTSKMHFFNMRAEVAWQFKEALDPNSGENIQLPPSPRVKAQLTAMRWKPKSGQIIVELKEDIIDRLGVSPDESDAILMAWWIRNEAPKKAIMEGRAKSKVKQKPYDPFSALN